MDRISMDELDGNLAYVSMKFFWFSVKHSSLDDIKNLKVFLEYMLKNIPKEFEIAQEEIDYVINTKKWLEHQLSKRREHV